MSRESGEPLPCGRGSGINAREPRASKRYVGQHTRHSPMVETIEWTEAGVVMIDQRRLPVDELYVTCRSYAEVAEAIRAMVIRGAPAIGVAAAMAVALGVLQAHEP